MFCNLNPTSPFGSSSSGSLCKKNICTCFAKSAQFNFGGRDNRAFLLGSGSLSDSIQDTSASISGSWFCTGLYFFLNIHIVINASLYCNLYFLLSPVILPMGLYWDLFAACAEVKAHSHTYDERLEDISFLIIHKKTEICIPPNKNKTSLFVLLGGKYECFIPDNLLPKILPFAAAHKVTHNFGTYSDTYTCWDGEVTFCACVVSPSSLFITRN